MPGLNTDWMDYDYAILKLKKKLTFSKTGPVAACLPTIQTNQQWADYAGKDAMASGWGGTTKLGANSDVFEEVTPSKMKELNVKVWSNQDCKEEFNKKGKRLGENTE